MKNKVLISLIHIFLGTIILFILLYYGYDRYMKNDKINLTAEEWQWISEHADSLTIVPDPDYPPMDFINPEGNHDGIAEDYFKIIERKLNIKFKRINPSGWTEVLEKAKNNQIDIIKCLAKSPERSEYLLFTQPYFDIDSIIVVKDDNPAALTLNSLKGKKVAVSEGYRIYEHIKNNYPEIEIVPVKNDGDAIIKTAIGEVYAAVSHLPTSSYYMKKTGINNLRIAGDAEIVYKLAIGSRKDIPILNTILIKTLNSISEKENDQIYNKWIKIEYNSYLYNRQFWMIAAISFSFVLVLYILIKFWGSSLHKKVKLRTNELEETKHNLEKILSERENELNVKIQTEIALKESNESLYNTMELLAEAEKMAALGGLVAGITHEVNTPLGLIITTATFLQKQTAAIQEKFRTGTLQKSELENILSTINESTEIILINISKAHSLMSSFKQIAVDQSAGDIREFSLIKIIDDCLLSLKPRLKRTKFPVNLDCPETIVMNSYPGAISQILTNLIMNSLIHGFENRNDGIISINCSEDYDGKIKIIYKDNGKGIPQENISRIFDPFFTTKRGKGGSGLGLHIVHNLITNELKGTIICNSESGNGVEFTIIIPKII